MRDLSFFGKNIGATTLPPFFMTDYDREFYAD